VEKTSPSAGLERTWGGEAEGGVGAQARKGGEVRRKAVFKPWRGGESKLRRGGEAEGSIQERAAGSEDR
jgi:hypothetical protein